MIVKDKTGIIKQAAEYRQEEIFGVCFKHGHAGLAPTIRTAKKL